MRKPFLVLFLFLIVFEIIVYATQPYFTELHKSSWRLVHLSQMIILIVLMLCSKKDIKQVQHFPSRTVYRLVLTGLIFSFMGDLINSYLLDLTFIIKTQSILSALPFSIAHILYIRSNYLISEQHASSSAPFFLSMKTLRIASLILWPLVAILLWKVLVSDTAPVLIKYLSFGYAFMVCLMALSSIWVLNALGQRGLGVAMGGFIFLCSDCIFGYFLMDGPRAPFWASQAIWTTYYTAQLFIAHSPLVLAKSVTDAANK